MEHEIAGQAVKAAMDGALVGTADRKKEPMTGKKALKAMERVMNALFFICGMVAVAFVLFISIYLIISGLPAILEIGPDQLPVRDPAGMPLPPEPLRHLRHHPHLRSRARRGPFSWGCPSA